MISCNMKKKSEQESKEMGANKIIVILDTDANNELDDQHAIAYMLFNGDVFDVKGITVNRTSGGGPIENHYEEALRIVKLCRSEDKIKVKKGASGNFNEIKDNIQGVNFDGHEAVNFIINTVKSSDEKIVLLPVGKLTNIALAIEKAPSIQEKIRIVWLGSNYPEPGEYNLENDTSALNYILQKPVPFEMVTVRYGETGGTDAVKVTPEKINETMPGLGPKIDAPITGRHGDEFNCFGDYSVNLFSHINLYGNPPSRALFDMAAVAIVKDPSWAVPREIPAPIYLNGQWQERPENERTITIWENFDRVKILGDFFESMKDYELIE